MNEREYCIDCGNYHPELGGWCDEKKVLMPWNSTCGKFKEIKK